MKEVYEEAKLEIVMFEAVDVIGFSTDEGEV